MTEQAHDKKVKVSDLQWLNNKIALWQRTADKAVLDLAEAEARLVNAQNQLAYYQRWVADVERSDTDES